MVKWSSLRDFSFSSCHCQNPGFVHTAAYVATARILAPFSTFFFHSSHFFVEKLLGECINLPHFFRQIITA